MARQPNRFNAVAMDLLTGSLGTCISTSAGAAGAGAAGAGSIKKSSPLVS